MTARRLLGPTGPLASKLPGYEHREGQLVMADAVTRALAEQRVLVCEAGTGTGKTLAYLVPAILSGLRVVVSTATKALQEQIIDKDVPLIESTLGVEAHAALVKGLGNYVCLRRLAEARLAGSTHRSLPVVERWAESSDSGDMADLAAVGDDDPVWRDVTSSSETRVGAGCAYFDQCFVTRMKRRAEGARLLIVNHHLFFADIAVKASMGRNAPRGGVLPTYDAVIFDEAHALEDIAATFFGLRLSRARVDALARDAERAFASAKLLEKSGLRTGPLLLLDALRDASHAFFESISQALFRARGRGSDSSETRVTLHREVWSGALLTAYHTLDDAIEALSGFAETHGVNEVVRQIRGRVDDVRDTLARIVDPATHHVAWAELGAKSVSIGATPIDVGPLLRERVIEPIGSVILTSATLATGTTRGDTSFDFFRTRMGLDTALDLPLDELEVASPFHFPSSAILYAPRDLPEVNDARFVDEATERIEALVRLTGGGAFVLCTSTRAMRAFADRLRDRTPGPLLVQGHAPKATLLARFRAHGDAVLVATMSFWEGVDVPGRALRLVIMDKIPFAVPTDPVTRVRSEAIEAAGRSAFADYTLPGAALVLKQGFGRLIRTQKDRGIVALFDRRLRTKGYGRALVAALPKVFVTEDIDDVDVFWQRVRDDDDALRHRSSPEK